MHNTLPPDTQQVPPSNAGAILDELAGRALDKIAEGNRLTNAGVEAYLIAGRTLNKAKRIVPRGQWRPWLDANGIGRRSAQRYMKLARLGVKSDTVTLLGGIAITLAQPPEELRWLQALRDFIEAEGLAAEYEAWLERQPERRGPWTKAEEREWRELQRELRALMP